MEASAQFAPQPMYGSMPEEELVAQPQKTKATNSFRANLLPICLSALVPWVLFLIVFAVMSFSIRYSSPGVSYAVVFLCFAGVFALQSTAAMMALKGRDATWFTVMSGLGLVAVVLGICFGGINYRHNIQPVQDALRLNTYEDIDPSNAPGSKVMDAGQIVFTKDTVLDLKRAMVFRNEQMYCVTPIINKNLPQVDGTYDFWAVGTNCCSGNAADFHCGEYDNPYAHAGLRVTSAHTVPYFKLAVKQAEAAYNIKASHPVLLTWLQDPLDEVSAAQDTGMRYYMVGLYTYLIGQLVVVGALAVALTNLGPWLMEGVL